MKRRIYTALQSVEDWIFDRDQPVFVSILKFFTVVGSALIFFVFAFLFLVSFIYPKHHVSLNLTDTWYCSQQHEELERVYHGKTSSMEYVLECDTYLRKPGHEHDWSK